MLETPQQDLGTSAGRSHLPIDPNGNEVVGSSPGQPQGCPGGRRDEEEPLEVTTVPAWQ